MNTSIAALSKLTLQTDFSPWFILLCLVLGAGYAYLLYSKKAPWSKQVNYTLAALRFLVVSLLAFFLLAPLFNQISYTDEAPILILGVDDSASVPAAYDSADFEVLKEQIADAAQRLGNSNLSVRVKSLSGYSDNFEELTFNEQSSNLHQILREVQQDFEQQNLVGTVLISDGIHNYGSSPQFLTLDYPVYALGIGDTIPAQDLSIKGLYYNKVVYQGKRFPLNVDVFNNGFVGESVKVEVLKGNQVVDSETIQLQGDQQINSAAFILDAEDLGIESYTVRLVPKANENSTANNVRRAFIETVDSQQKILIAAASPHPDIKALRTVIESKEGTEVAVWIEGFEADFPEGPFDLVIYHQLPGFNDLPAQIGHWVDDTNTLFITGSGELSGVNRANKTLIYQSFGQTDNVSAALNTGFDLFEMDEGLLRRFSNYPPIKAPYGAFELKENANIMLYQRVGSVTTTRPLLTHWSDEERKSATFSGAGLWEWKLQEAAIYGDSKLFDELFGKLIQYLATTDDKRNFRVTSVSETFFDNEPAEFETEVYNQLFEKVYDYNIDLTLTDAEGTSEEFNYVNTPGTNFQINGLTTGVYKYSAQVSLNGKTETAEGSFAVETMALEDIDLTANHQLLRNIANNSGGQFFNEQSLDQLVATILAVDAKPISRSSERLNPLINNQIWLILLLILLSAEWFLRKYNGSY
ncbi:vWA domain-containing protein [Roseivirga pacifica]|uniref:vWA domain-containing protein n=1 Tax=Roseivirga pacifica TaxID=1267423 RepID=UPI00227CEE21|nr:vWA domain-containing protein [Roseivirga pacifica]